MTFLLLAICWIEVYPYNPADSVFCEIYDAEVELIGDTIKNIEVSSETGESDAVQMVMEKGRIKMKIPKGVKIFATSRNSDCHFVKISGEVCFSNLLRSGISFDTSASKIKILEANSSDITINQNKGTISCDKLVATTVAIRDNEGDIIIKEGVIGRVVRDKEKNIATVYKRAIDLVNCRGNYFIHNLQGDLDIKECMGHLKVEHLVGKIFLLKNSRAEKFQEVLEDIEIQL